MGHKYRWDVEEWEPWEVPYMKKMVNRFKNGTHISRRGKLCDWRQVLRDEPFEDMMQEVSLDWHSVRDGYDPSRYASLQTYMRSIVRNKLIEIVTRKTAKKRKTYARVVSLDERISEDEDAPTYSDCLVDKRTINLKMKLALKIDVSEVEQKLSVRQRKLCGLRKEDRSMKECGRILKTPRTTLYGDMEHAETVYRSKKMEEYL